MTDTPESARTRVAVKLRLTPAAKRKLERCAAYAGQTVSDYATAMLARESEPCLTPGRTRMRLAEARRTAAGRRGA